MKQKKLIFHIYYTTGGNMVKNTEEKIKKKAQPSVDVLERVSEFTKMRTTMIIAVIGIAILLMFIGTTMTSTSDNSGTYKAGVVVNNLGVTALGGTLFLGAFNKQLDSNIKMGMMIAAGIVLGIGFI